MPVELAVGDVLRHGDDGRRALRSSEPRSRFTSAAARLIRPSARTISIGMRSVPMRKLCSERSVCAPQSLSAGMSSGPKASLSMRVFWRVFWRVLAGFWAITSCGNGRAGPLRRRRLRLVGLALRHNGLAGGAGAASVGTLAGRRFFFADLALRCPAFALRLALRIGRRLASPWPSTTSSNCRPNCTDGSKKPVIASNGMLSFSRDAAERQADLETLLGHRQIPELVLQDDGHLRPDTARAAGRTCARRRPWVSNSM